MSDRRNQDDASSQPWLPDGWDNASSSPSRDTTHRVERTQHHTTKSTSWSSSHSRQRIELPPDPADPENLDSPRIIEAESRSINGRESTIFRITDGRGSVREYDSPDALPPRALEALARVPMPTGFDLPDNAKEELRATFKSIVRDFESSPFIGKLDVRDLEADLERAMRGEPTTIIGKHGFPQTGPLAWMLKRGLASGAKHNNPRVIDASPRPESDFIGSGPRDPFAHAASSRNRILYVVGALAIVALIVVLVALALR